MASAKKHVLSIGTSNIVIPGNKQSFPQAFQDKSILHYYSSLFNSLEVNSSFYKVPQYGTFEKWAADVPHDFKFSIKLWKEITHAKNLSFEDKQVAHFLKSAEGLGNKKGCLLVQFPGKISMDQYNEVEHLLSLLEDYDPDNSWQKVIEFRNNSWYVSETSEMLDNFNASMVLHDIPKSANGVLNKNAKVAYTRFHGPAGNYRDGYSDQYLDNHFKQMQAWQKEGKQVYSYFNNSLGDAYKNAVYLQSLIVQLAVPCMLKP